MITFFSVVGIVLLGIIFWVLFKALLGNQGVEVEISGSATAVDIAINNFLERPIEVKKDNAVRIVTYGELIALASENKEWRDVLKEEIEGSGLLKIGTLLTDENRKWEMSIEKEDGTTIYSKGSVYLTAQNAAAYLAQFFAGRVPEKKTYEEIKLLRGLYKEYYIPDMKGRNIVLKYYWRP
ncbi:hypothetical protein D6764_05095 [Candidatus Woesearchaeota archaeon]|nr:MAG: hypothetical protein D6764_05095 [Candidatus Woesearchaeota archaeon]